jgi:hypothetical protein
MQRRVVNFRADSEMVDALWRRAHEQGVSLSEILRDAVRERIGSSSDEAPPAVQYVDAFTLLNSAARGSLDAQRALADEGIRRAALMGDDFEACLREGAIFARLAASQGDESDKGRLISMLALLGDVGDADALAEATAVIDGMADDGNEMCAAFMANAGDFVTAEGLALVKSYRDRMVAANREAL